MSNMLLKDILTWSFTGCVLLIITVGPIYARRQEKKNWNRGYCPTCGKPWIHYDTDSQGGRMYRCENWHSCDISYRVDKIDK